MPTTTRSRLLLVDLIVVAALAGCGGGWVPPPESPRFELPPVARQTLGTVETSGPLVFVNRVPAVDGQTLFVDDLVTTGSASSARLLFTGGGLCQLDENTDPIFFLKRLQEGYCIAMRIVKGQAWIEESRFCVETPDAEGETESRVNIRVTPPTHLSTYSSVITVVSGRLKLTRPEWRVIEQGNEARIRADTGELESRRVPAAELAEVGRWRERYRFKGSRRPVDAPPPPPPPVRTAPPPVDTGPAPPDIQAAADAMARGKGGVRRSEGRHPDALTLEELATCLKLQAAAQAAEDRLEPVAAELESERQSLDRERARLESWTGSKTEYDRAAAEFRRRVDHYQEEMLPRARAAAEEANEAIDRFNEPCAGERYYIEDLETLRRRWGH